MQPATEGGHAYSVSTQVLYTYGGLLTRSIDMHVAMHHASLRPPYVLRHSCLVLRETSKDKGGVASYQACRASLAFATSSDADQGATGHTILRVSSLRVSAASDGQGLRGYGGKRRGYRCAKSDDAHDRRQNDIGPFVPDVLGTSVAEDQVSKVAVVALGVLRLKPQWPSPTGDMYRCRYGTVRYRAEHDMKGSNVLTLP